MLGLDDALAKSPRPPDQVLAEQLWHDVLMFEMLTLLMRPFMDFFNASPSHALIFLALLIRDLGLERAQPSRRDVGTAGSHRQELFVLSLRRGLLLLFGADGRRGRRRACLLDRAITVTSIATGRRSVTTTGRASAGLRVRRWLVYLSRRRLCCRGSHGVDWTCAVSPVSQLLKGIEEVLCRLVVSCSLTLSTVVSLSPTKVASKLFDEAGSQRVDPLSYKVH